MTIWVVRDLNFGNIDEMFAGKQKAKKRLDQVLKDNRELYNDRYAWTIEEWEIIE